MSTSETDTRQSLLDTIDGMAQSGGRDEEIIQAAADGLRDATDIDQIFVMVCEHDEPVLSMRYASLGAYERQQIRNSMSMDLQSVTVPLSQDNMVAELFRCGLLAELEDMEEVAELARTVAPQANIATMAADAVRNQGIGYACVMPILAGDDLRGVLIASRYGRKPLPPEDTALVQAVAALMGPALNGAQA